jgi:hypothetical protein
MDQKNKPIKLSNSQKDVYELCPYKYYLYYIKKYRSTIQGSALLMGNAFDEALNDLLINRDLNKAKEIFTNIWLSHKDKQIEYYAKDSLVDHSPFDSLLIKGIKCLESYYEHILPKIKNVVSVQEKINLTASLEEGANEPDSITGIIDFIGTIEYEGKEYTGIFDNKTTSSPYPKNSVVKKEQLPLYAYCKDEYDYQGYLTVNKHTYETQIIIDTIPLDRKLEVIDKFDKILNDIKENEFPKNKKGCWSFGKKCIYYSHCHEGGEFSSDIYQEVKEEE